MTTRAIEEVTMSSRLVDRWDHVGQKLVALAEEIPEDRFNYRTTDGVRTLEEVLRHVGFWNFYVRDVALGKKGNDQGNELSKGKASTKSQIIDVLKTTFAAASDTLRSTGGGLSLQKAEMLVTFIEHTCEHYGQLVVYARLNGIVPPTSRG
jgi:uncharacterized damage-inducible protein DinB